jgi:signal transduction histidine kinase
MVEESDHLIRLVNDLLLLARADAGRNLASEPFQVSPVVDETVRQVRLLDPQRQINLDTTADLTIHGDRDAFKQVMLILLDNAIKHSEGNIDVCAQENNGKVEIRMRDYGEGIAPEILPHIFDRFYRGEDQSSIPGFGLGLPIAKVLVEGMKGNIALESHFGEGCEVIMRFQSMD